MFLALVCGCLNSDSDGKSSDQTSVSGFSSNTDSSAVDTGAEDDSGGDIDSGQTEEPADPMRLEGQMAAEYTYSGSFGEFTDGCEGDSFITIDSEAVLAGEGACANDIISFGFVIEGIQDGDELTGILIGESSAGRAETPFSGTISDAETVLNFDHIHAADGESLRLVGTLNLMATR
jgi:hypothetical protein